MVFTHIFSSDPTSSASLLWWNPNPYLFTFQLSNLFHEYQTDYITSSTIPYFPLNTLIHEYHLFMRFYFVFRFFAMIYIWYVLCVGGGGGRSTNQEERRDSEWGRERDGLNVAKPVYAALTICNTPHQFLDRISCLQYLRYTTQFNIINFKIK